MSEGTLRNRQLPCKANTTTMIKMLILSLLSEKSYYGNEIIDKVSAIMKNTWKPSNGMIYPLLSKMEEDMLIVSWWEIPDKKTKRYYKITDEGIRHYNIIKNRDVLIIQDNISVLENILKALR